MSYKTHCTGVLSWRPHSEVSEEKAAQCYCAEATAHFCMNSEKLQPSFHFGLHKECIILFCFRPFTHHVNYMLTEFSKSLWLSICKMVLNCILFPWIFLCSPTQWRVQNWGLSGDCSTTRKIFSPLVSSWWPDPWVLHNGLSAALSTLATRASFIITSLSLVGQGAPVPEDSHVAAGLCWAQQVARSCRLPGPAVERRSRCHGPRSPPPRHGPLWARPWGQSSAGAAGAGSHESQRRQHGAAGVSLSCEIIVEKNELWFFISVINQNQNILTSATKLETYQAP